MRQKMRQKIKYNETRSRFCILNVNFRRAAFMDNTTVIIVKATVLVHPKSTYRWQISWSPLYELGKMGHHHDKVWTLSKVEWSINYDSQKDHTSRSTAKWFNHVIKTHKIALSTNQNIARGILTNQGASFQHQFENMLRKIGKIWYSLFHSVPYIFIAFCPFPQF